MAQNKLETFGPVALTSTLTTNIIHPADAGANGVGYTPGVAYILLTHIRIVSKAAGAVTFSLWLGATGANTAGTEVVGSGYTIAGGGTFDWYGRMRITNSQYLVGGASANTSLTLEAEGEVGLV